MKKIICLLMCFFCCLNAGLKADDIDDELIHLFSLGVEYNDQKLIQNAVEALAGENNKILLDVLIKYGKNGNFDLALHRAIKDKNIIASILLAYYFPTDINKDLGKEFCPTYNVSRDTKTTSLELALEADMKALIPYFIMKGYDINHVRSINFIYENEIILLNCWKNLLTKYPDIDRNQQQIISNNQTVYLTNMKVTFFGDLIIDNNLEIIELLIKYFDLKRHCCTGFTPFQLSLALNHYDIALFLLNHGAKVE